MVVTLAVVFDHYARFAQRPQLLAVEAFVAEATVEAFHEPVLPRTAWVDVNGLDALLRQPALHLPSDKLRAVVTAQVLRRAMLRDRLFQPLQHVLRAQRAVRAQHMTLARVLVQDGQHAQRSPAHGPVRDKIPGPHVTASRGFGRQTSGQAAAHLPAPGRWHAQAGRAPQALDVSLTRGPTFAPQQRRDTSVAIAWVFLGELPQPPRQSLLARGRRPHTIPIRRACEPQEPARRAPRTQPCRHHLHGHFLALPWAYHFFSHTASNTLFLSSDSASIFFNSAFSRSSSFSRLA